MDELELLNAVYEGVVLKCAFDENKKFADTVITYSYKSNLEDIEIGDKVYIESKYGYIRSVVVIEIADGMSLEPDVRYGWAIAKVETDAYDELKLKDAETLVALRNAKRISVRRQILNNSGIEESDLIKLGLIKS